MTPAGRATPAGRRRVPVGPAALLALLLVAAPPLLANGGKLRISRAPVGPYLVSVFTSPTPLRTGELDLSVLVQDSAEQGVNVPIVVVAEPVGFEAEPVRQPATRAQATNKLFKAAKFGIETPGLWEFRIRVGGDGGPGGVLTFQAELTRTTLMDRPYLLALLVVVPLGLVGWLLSRQGTGEPDRGS